MRLDGLDDVATAAEWLPRAFAKGGWVPVAVPHNSALAELDWTGSGRLDLARVALPKPGNITLVVRTKTGLKVTPNVAPSVADGVRVAMAEAARGDLFAAIAVLESTDKAIGTLSGGQRLTLAELLRKTGLPTQATAVYHVLGDNPAARLGLARIAFDGGRYDDVLTALKPLAPGVEGPLASAVTDLSLRSLVALDRARDAVEGLPRGGGDPFLRANRATAFRAIGDTFSALFELKKAAALVDPEVPEQASLRERVWLTLGATLAEQGKLSDAMDAFGRVNPAGPFGDRYRFARGLAFFGNQERIKAVTEFQALQREHPYSPYTLEGLLVMAGAYRDLNAPRQAVTEYRKALELLQDRVHTIRSLLQTEDDLDRGLTGRLFPAVGMRVEPSQRADLKIGEEILLADPDVARLITGYRRIDRTRMHLEVAKRRLLRQKMTDAVALASAAQDGVAALQGRFRNAARQVVVDLLETEQRQVEELSVAASLGLTQSVLFDSTGRDGSELVFQEAP